MPRKVVIRICLNKIPLPKNDAIPNREKTMNILLIFAYHFVASNLSFA